MPKYLPEVDLFTNILNNEIWLHILMLKQYRISLYGSTEGFRIFTILKYTVTDLGNKVMCQGPPQVNI